MCCGSLTGKGKFWAFVSIIAAGAAGTCFYWPDWINGPAQVSVGRNVTFEYGLFRRCNYIERRLVNETQEVLELRTACGRYEGFQDIPSVWWQVSTILVGVAAGLLILVALTALFAVFLEDVCSKVLAYVAGITQLLAALSLTVSLFLYPLGWDKDIIRNEACRDSARYKLGECNLGVAFYIAIGAAVVAFLATFLSPFARKRKGRDDYVI
eukprot:scpid52582/ scgid32748/ Lipoma HMGIC fusion partner